jgi:hypothetical protein
MLRANAEDLLHVLRRASTATSNAEFRVLLRDREFKSFVGREGTQTLILGIRYSPESDHGPDLVTDFASLTFANAVTLPGSAATGPFMLLRFEADAEDLEALAAALFEGLLNLAESSWPQCRAASAAAVETFQGQLFARGNLDEQAGLFGELVTIAISSDPARMVNAWHENRYAVHDFAIGHSRLEVKTSMSQQRLHWIGERQVIPASGESVTFASVYAPSVHQGMTCADISQEIESHLSGESLVRFRRKLNQVPLIGDLFEFDRVVAQSNILFIAGEHIPRPEVRDPRIRSVKWRVDLSGLAPAPEGLQEPWASLLSGL